MRVKWWFFFQFLYATIFIFFICMFNPESNSMNENMCTYTQTGFNFNQEQWIDVVVVVVM